MPSPEAVLYIKPIKMQSIVKEAMTLLRASIPRAIDIVQRIREDCGPVLADATQVHKIVMNLATNAYWTGADPGPGLSGEFPERGRRFKIFPFRPIS